MATGISTQIRGGLPFWTASSGTGSEPQRTKYICESVLYRFLARTKACLEFPLTPISMLYSNIGYYFLCVSAESTWHIPVTSCMSTQCSSDVKLSIGWSEKVQLPEGENLEKLYLPGLSSKYFRAHLVNRRRFQPACCFTAGKSDARRNLLQLVTEFTSVQRMQTKLTPIFSNGCV